MNTPYAESEKLRAHYYGKPGKYRIQNYPNGDVGVEYRTPSNSWLSYDFRTFQKMLELSTLALSNLSNISVARDIIYEYAPETINAITKADSEKSKSVLEAMKVL
jgi:hypothetical protein